MKYIHRVLDYMTWFWFMEWLIFVYIINRVIYGRLEIWNLSSRVHIRYLTGSLRSLIRYRCEQSKINSISPRGHVFFSINITRQITLQWTRQITRNITRQIPRQTARHVSLQKIIIINSHGFVGTVGICYQVAITFSRKADLGLSFKHFYFYVKLKSVLVLYPKGYFTTL